MTRIFWDTIFLISGSLFTFGAGPSNSTIIETHIVIDTNSSAPPNTSTSSPATTSSANTTTATTDVPTVKNSLFTFEAEPTNLTNIIGSISSTATNTLTSSSETTSNRSTTTTAIPATTTGSHPVKKFVAAAVRSHFNDCPDSHRHFCFHGTCRFLILEETPACVCHPGFVGMRCEHADLLAVVATNHRQQTTATVMVLCVIGCVLIIVLCTLLHCWWRQECRRRHHIHHYISEKHGASRYPSESVV